jgi:ABC-type multidrug transport system fused ATPase/permease subunit
MRLRSAVISAVYQKSLRLSQASRSKEGASSGEVVNLMAIDAQRFMDVVTYIHMLWSAPLQIALSLYFLFDLLEGYSVLAGLGVMIVMIPINIVIAKNERACSRKLMKKKDSRIKEMNEVLNGMKVLKLYVHHSFSRHAFFFAHWLCAVRVAIGRGLYSDVPAKTYVDAHVRHCEHNLHQVRLGTGVHVQSPKPSV